MKKIIMAAMLFCGVISASAQSDGQFRFGVTGGMNVANVTDLDADCRIGFNVGARIEYGIAHNVYLGSGLLLSQKGFKDDDTEVTGSPLYLELPIQVGYNYSLGNGVSLFGETGPYLAFGVGGKLKREGKYDHVDVVVKTDYFGDDAADVFDMGWALRAGVGVNNFQIHLGYEYGFTKVSDEGSNHNSNFNVGLTYFF